MEIPDIWCNNYIVTGYDILAKIIRKSQKTEIAIPVKLNLKIEWLSLYDDFNELYGNSLSFNKLFFSFYNNLFIF